MICPNCGLNFDQPVSGACPRCGYALASGVPPTPPMEPSPAARSSQPSAPPAPGWGTISGAPTTISGAPTTISGAPTTISGAPTQSGGTASAPASAPGDYGQFASASGPLLPPGAQQQAVADMGQYGQYSQYGQYGQSGSPALVPYGQPAAVSNPLYGQPAASSGSLYGQAAAASGPMQGQPVSGQQPGQELALYGQSAPAVENEPSTWILAAVAPEATAQKGSRRRGRVIVIAALAVVVVLALAGGGLVALSSRDNSVVLFSDSLTTDSGHWPTNSSCTFQPDGYHIVDGYICYADSGTYGDVTISAQVRQVSGSSADAYSGIALRRVSAGNLYTFGITSSGQWMFVKTVGDSATAVAGPQTSAAINHGLGSANTLQVRAKGSHFDLFVNGTQVGSANDATFTSGLCGLFADQSIESSFTQFQVSR